MDKIVTDRIAREKRSLETAHNKTLAERDAELQKYRDAEAAQQAAAMSELEKAQKAAADAQAETARLQAQVAECRRTRTAPSWRRARFARQAFGLV